MEMRKKNAGKSGASEVILAAENELDKKVLATSGAVVVKFWDGKPHLGQDAIDFVASKNVKGLKFATVVVKGRETRKKYNIKNSPTYVFFEGKAEKSRIPGITPKEALEVWCELNASA